MKVIMDIRDAQLERVGVSVYCENLIKIFDKSDDIEYIFIASNKMKKIEGINSKILYIAPSSNSSILEKVKWYYKLPSILEGLEADLYFGPILKLPFIKKFPCKTAFTIHDAASLKSPALIGSKIKFYINKYFSNNMVSALDATICISQHARDEFIGVFGQNLKDKSPVIYHGVPFEITQPYLFSKDEERKVLDKYLKGSKYFITVGTVYHKKNITRLVEAISLLNDPSVELLICGAPGHNSDDIFLAPDKYKVSDSVHFLGRVETNDIRILLKNAKAFVFPSLYEGFGIPILEAYSVGVPVLSSNATCLPEIAGDAALYFDPYSVEDMVEKMESILNDNGKLSSTMVSKGYKRATNFSWEKSALEHEILFKRLIEHHE